MLGDGLRPIFISTEEKKKCENQDNKYSFHNSLFILFFILYNYS